MSRGWPIAERAWRVIGSVGYSPVGAMAATPAVTAPEVTTTTVWPSRRRPATSLQSLPTAAVSTEPPEAVTELVPILAMTITLSALRLVSETQIPDAHSVTVAGTCARKGAIDPDPLQATVHVRQRVQVRQV